MLNIIQSKQASLLASMEAWKSALLKPRALICTHACTHTHTHFQKEAKKAIFMPREIYSWLGMKIDFKKGLAMILAAMLGSYQAWSIPALLDCSIPSKQAFDL